MQEVKLAASIISPETQYQWISRKYEYLKSWLMRWRSNQHKCKLADQPKIDANFATLHAIQREKISYEKKDKN